MNQLDKPFSYSAVLRIIGLLAALWAAWILLQALLLALPVRYRETGSWHTIALLVSIVLFLSVATWATCSFIVIAARYSREVTLIRPWLIACCAGVAVGLYIAVRVAGHAGHLLTAMGTANLIALAILVGTWIVYPLRRPAELVPVAVVMALADLYSVFTGPSAKIVEGVARYYENGMTGVPPIGDFLLVKLAVPGFADPVPMFGAADWMAVAFLTAAAAKFGLDDNLLGPALLTKTGGRGARYAMPIAVVALVLAVYLANIFDTPLPALPLVAGAFIGFVLLRYPDARRLRQSDWLLLAFFSVFIVGLMVVSGMLR